MGTRIGVLWRKEKEGVAYLTGHLSVESGICIPPNARMQVTLRKNDQKKEGDKRPDFFIEAWEPREQTGGGGTAGDPGDGVPF